MTPERLRQIEALYHAVREHPAILSSIDPDLRREVEALLAQQGPLPRLSVEATQTQITPGATLGPYRIQAFLGAGGMGQVFRGVDTRLDRKVAVKVSAVQFGERFEREARAISALNHPHICTLYDVGPNYLVMEFIEGDSLATLIKKGSLSIDLVLRYGIEIADALAEAHSKGITHRDLKPGNVMVTKMGVNRTGVKVLDFGLARISGDPLTQSKGIMGTPAYMSPEQQQGREADARSDIYSLGLVLYEMATGHRMPQPAQLDSLPVRLAHVVDRCLQQDPEDRWQTARNVKAELEWSSLPTTEREATPPPTPPRRTKWLWPSLSAALIVAALFTFRWYRAPATINVSTQRSRPFAYTQEQEIGGAWSPDGKSIAFLRGGRLLVQPVEGGDAIQLASSASLDLAFSPDGSEVYFISDGAVKAVSRVGGEPRVVLARTPNVGISSFDLSPDGKSLALWQVTRAADGGPIANVWISSPPGSEPKPYSPAPFAVPGGYIPNFVRFSRNGKQIFLATYTIQGAQTWLLPFPSGSGMPRRIFRDVQWSRPPDASWMPDGRRLILSSGIAPTFSIFALFLGDLRDESLTRLSAEAGPTVHQDYPRVSPDGRSALVTRDTRDSDIVELPLDGSPPRKLLATSLPEHSPAWSPKGGQLAYISERNGAVELWVRGAQGEFDRPVVTAKEIPGLQGISGPAFSPDGTRIAYTAHLNGPDQGGLNAIYVSPTAGGTPAHLAPGGGPTWSPDGASIAFLMRKPNGAGPLGVLHLGSQQPPVEIFAPGCGAIPRWSPSGEWIFCASGENGRVLLSPDGKVKRMVPTPGAEPWGWSQDSSILYRLSPVEDHMELIAFDLRTDKMRTVAEYSREQVSPYSTFRPGLSLSLSPDGKSFAIGTIKRQADLWILEGLR